MQDKDKEIPTKTFIEYTDGTEKVKITPRLDFAAFDRLGPEIEKRGFMDGSIMYVLNSVKLISQSPEKGLIVLWASILHEKPNVSITEFLNIADREKWKFTDIAMMVSSAINECFMFQELGEMAKKNEKKKKNTT